MLIYSHLPFRPKLFVYSNQSHLRRLEWDNDDILFIHFVVLLDYAALSSKVEVPLILNSSFYA